MTDRSLEPRRPASIDVESATPRRTCDRPRGPRRPGRAASSRARGSTRASISIALVDDATIQRVNRRHLGHDWPTDVISFPLSEPGRPDLAGELVVSAEMAAATARRGGVDPWAELALYVVHGLLHLCGYDDRAAADVDAMRRRESEILAREGLTNTFPLVGLAEADDRERESVRWSD